MAEPRWFTFNNRDELARILAADVASSLQDAIRQRGSAVLAVSGGSTPAPFFKVLRQENLFWPKVTILMVDERWVPTDHPDSNERMLHDYWRHTGLNIASLAPQSAHESLTAGALRLNEQLASLGPIDIAVLGMGEDGHTASLFPGHPVLMEALDPECEAECLPVDQSPKPPPQRVTLTAKRLLAARQLLLHITSGTKKQVYETAMTAPRPAEYPIAALLKQSRQPCAVYWSE